MAGERDLQTLLRSMRPLLHDAPYGYGLAETPVEVSDCFAQIFEDEGVTVIAPTAQLQAAGLAVAENWARISLSVQSDLAAVGLTSAFAAALTAEGISANVVAGFHHDHIFVPWGRRHDAMTALEVLSDV